MGVELWEAWKRAWDLWNGHYIEGRADQAYIMGEYNRLKGVMDADNIRKRGRPSAGGGGGGGGRKPPTPVRFIYSRVYSKNQPPAPPAGRVWVRHRYRTKTIREPTGQTVQRNNPNPPSTQRIATRRVRKLVQKSAGPAVAIYQKVSRNLQGLETQILRANGPWNPNLTSWATIRSQRLAGTLVPPPDTETTPEPAEPTGTITITHQVNTTPKHLEFVDLTVSQVPRPLMSWAALAAARRTPAGIPACRSRFQEDAYEPSRPQVWVPDDYDLIDTGKLEVLLDDRTTENDVVEQLMESVPGNPIETVPVMADIKIPQWLEMDDPTIPPVISSSSSNAASEDEDDGGGGEGGPPPPVIPRSDPLNSHVNGTKDTPRYPEWQRNLPARWDAVNPGRLSSTNDPNYIAWRDGQIERVREQWWNLSGPGSFQGPTHSSGFPVIEDHLHSRDEDMVDVSDQEFQDAFAEDEDMEDDYEQRSMGPGSGAGGGVGGGLAGLFGGDDGDGGGNDNEEEVGDDDDTSEISPPDLGPLPRGPDGVSGGFRPLKLVDEYREPDRDVNEDLPDDWTDNIENTVWRPRRVGEKTLRIDLDEPWENITDLEVDGGLDCGRSPYPVLRSINKYIRNELLEDATQEPRITYRKEKVWDGVTGSIFNMPTGPDEPEAKSPDDRERPRSDIFPLDIRRVKQIDPTTGRPFESEVQTPLLPGESEVDLDLLWNNPTHQYSKFQENNPWWVTPEQERLRDVPPRRHPPTDQGRDGDLYLPLDQYRWQQERLLDRNNQANYFVTNLHGGTILINGQQVEKGCIAGPLPAFAYIQTPGNQVSFWWGPGGRNWRRGKERGYDAEGWRQLRRMPRWENIGVNAGVVWTKKIKDRLVREQSGNDQEDDEQWEAWKNPLTSTSPSSGSSAGRGPGREEGRNTDPNNNDPPVVAKRVHGPLEICYAGTIKPPSSSNVFKPPDRFDTEEVELEWLHTRAQPLRDAIMGAVQVSQQQVQQLKALSSLIAPDPDGFFPGANQPEHPEIDVQRQKQTEWPAKKAQILLDQQAVNFRVFQRRIAEEAARDLAYTNSIQTINNKRRLLQNERDDQARRIRRKVEQEARDAQANFLQVSATSATTKQTQARAENHDKRVKEEAAELSRIIGLTITNPSLVQLNAAAVTRTSQWTQQLQAKAVRLASHNAALAAQRKPRIHAQPQESRAEFDNILRDAVQLLGPERAASQAAAARAAQDAENLRIQTAISARTSQDAQQRRQAKQNIQSKSTGPPTVADALVEARRTRYQTAAFRDEAQKLSGAYNLQMSVGKRLPPPPPINKAPKAVQKPPQLAPPPPPQPQNHPSPFPDAAKLATLKLAADQERLARVNRVPLVAPGTMNPTQKTTYDNAVLRRANDDPKMRQYIPFLAATANLTVYVFIQRMYAYNDLDDYIEKFDYDQIVRRATPVRPRSPTQRSPSPSRRSRPQGKLRDTPPAGTSRPINLRPDPPPFNWPSTGSRGQNKFLQFCQQIRDAVKRGLEARTKLEGITVWQAAHKMGWSSLQAITDHYLSTIGLFECPETQLEVNPAYGPDKQVNFHNEFLIKILNASDMEAAVMVQVNTGPVEHASRLFFTV